MTACRMGDSFAGHGRRHADTLTRAGAEAKTHGGRTVAPVTRRGHPPAARMPTPYWADAGRRLRATTASPAAPRARSSTAEGSGTAES